ncbi:hypothetical protein A1O7_04305 [Cladophialophora yegresii CBS 114405]|uniref:BTB domain-containing protein n=1 Tax=Cladophialophora yegresii CBS 114405 TaxID=1182544 RepID=W9VWT9_9EURO|nr:uncharacterized protein A1O7_04305 [Cladophialophora yegresii CBS 114405]EXJ60153.1 hypothetical protein A1O7_04305 [Cladophialophora yegresii CBS 114405]
MADKGPPNKKQKTDNGASSFVLSDIITVVVGPEAKKFHLHESVLVSESLFFRGCLQSGMKEQIEKTVVLPEDDWEIFGILADLVYTKTVSSANNFRALLSAYILADRLLMPRLQNELMYCMCARLCPAHGQYKVSVEEVSWVWNNTTEGSKLRLFMVDALHEIMSSFDYNEQDGRPITEHYDFKRAAQLKKAIMENGDLGYELYSKVINCVRSRHAVYDYARSPPNYYYPYLVRDLEEQGVSSRGARPLITSMDWIWERYGPKAYSIPDWRSENRKGGLVWKTVALQQGEVPLRNS